MKVSSTAIADVLLIEPRVFTDARGYFFESYNARAFAAATGLSPAFIQDNHAKSVHGVLRGLHYQEQFPQGKLVRVISGEVFDVAVDLRPTSPTYGRWIGEYLSASNQRQLWIPPGLAHGYLVTSQSAEFVYKTTEYYAPEFERCIAWNDAELQINWPLNGMTPIVSIKDAQGRNFSGL